MEPISDERWQQIEALLDQVLEHPPEKRRAFLDQRCADDPELRKQLERVLGASEAPESFLEDSDGQHFAAMLEDLDLATDPHASEHPAGEHIGPYRLIRPIGRGGMGQVYLAMRDDQSFKRYVALKVIRRGLDTEDILHRFRIERQILASLAHPNIARLLDGGATDDGLSYFVMEYIEGVPIDTYCNTHRLSVDARLRLFQGVCAAVHYAHQNLIVHRDLKPSNILVTSEGVPKLLDFGIAKFLNPNLPGYTVPMTRTEMRVMTPEYASPEQVRGETLTTASDVYSLGVLLYELLTGHRPYQFTKRGQIEVERVICETEPESPSTVITHVEEQHHSDGTTTTITPEAISRARDTQPEWLKRRLSGDLDTIVLLALRKEPERRYKSAEAFWEDIKRHLAGLPVNAQRATMGYRTRKFIQRHRLGVATATALVVLLLTVAGLSIWFALVTRTQADRIALEAAKSEQVTAFMVGLFEESDPANARGEEITARELLDQGVEQIEVLEGQPEVQAKMLNTLGVVYYQLGSYEKAQPLLERSLAQRRAALGPEHEDIAQSLYDLSWVLGERGAYEESEQLLLEALTMWRKLLGDNHPNVAQTLNDLGVTLFETGDFDKSEAYFREALMIRREVFEQDHEDLAESMHNLASILHERRAYDEAEELYRISLTMWRNVLGEDHPNVRANLNSLGTLMYDRGAYDEAETLFRESLALRRKLMGSEHPITAHDMSWLGRALYKKGNYDEAEPLYRDALVFHRKLLGEAHPVVGRDLNFLAQLLLNQGDENQAEQLLQEALAIFQAALPNEHPYVALAKIDLGRLYLDQHRPEEAEPPLREALGIQQALYGEEDERVAEAQQVLGACLMALTRYEEAEAQLLESFTYYQRQEHTEELQQTRQALFDLYTAWDQPQKAAPYKD